MSKPPCKFKEGSFCVLKDITCNNCQALTQVPGDFQGAVFINGKAYTAEDLKKIIKESQRCMRQTV